MNARARKTEQLSFWGHVHRSYGSTRNHTAKQTSAAKYKDLAEKQGLYERRHGLACPRLCAGRAPSEQGIVPRLNGKTCPRFEAGRAPDGQADVPQPCTRACPGLAGSRASDLK